MASRILSLTLLLTAILGSIDKGKFADVIAVSGNPVADVGEMERVKFVMKGGMVIRNEVIPAAVARAP